MTTYRDNENTTLTEDLDNLRARVLRIEERGIASGDAKMQRSITRWVVGGIFFLSMGLAGVVWSCQRTESQAKVDVARESVNAARETAKAPPCQRGEK